MLGSALVKEFGTDFEVVAWDRADCDITKPEMITASFNTASPALVINASAHNGVDIVETDLAAYAQAEAINTLAVGNLARWCKNAGVPLVHFSTDYVFDGANTLGYDENAPTNPISKYGATKALGEILLREATDAFYLIRLSRLFGAPGPSSASKKSFVDIMLDLVINQGKKEIKLINEELSCPTYSVDVARFTRLLITRNEPFGIYHAANSGACTWFEFGKKIFALKNLEVTVVPILGAQYPRAAKRPAYSELLNTKLPFARTWEDALAEYLA